MSTETLWHVIVLSNFARGYDKYARRYSKEAIPESTFPDHFLLMRGAELPAGKVEVVGKGALRDRLLRVAAGILEGGNPGEHLSRPLLPAAGSGTTRWNPQGRGTSGQAGHRRRP